MRSAALADSPGRAEAQPAANHEEPTAYTLEFIGNLLVCPERLVQLTGQSFQASVDLLNSHGHHHPEHLRDTAEKMGRPRK